MTIYSQTETKILTQKQAIRHFIEKMDIEMVDAFLDNDKTYQGSEKYVFISKLQQVFETFVEFGDTHLLSVEGNCNSCEKFKTGFTFIGNNSRNYINLIFEIEENKIKNLSEICRNFNKSQTNLNLQKRIYIDEDSSIPF